MTAPLADRAWNDMDNLLTLLAVAGVSADHFLNLLDGRQSDRCYALPLFEGYVVGSALAPDVNLPHPLQLELPGPAEKRAQWLLAWGLVLLALALVTAGVFIYDYQRQIIEQQKQQELTAIADIKVAQVTGWLAQRRADAEAAAGDALLAREVAHWIAHGARADSDSGRFITARLDNLNSVLNCRGVILFDPAGQVRAAAGDASVDAGERQQALQAMATGKTRLTDFYLRDGEGDSDSHIEFDQFAPLLVHTGDVTAIAGALYFKVDPRQYLFPLVKAWPTPSPSAEALLVRRDGEDVVYLSDLRHQSGTPLTVRQPVAAPAGSAAMAVRGEAGVFDGIDYRGERVLAASRMVPGMPWFLVAKVDAAEVYAPIKTLAVIVTGLEVLFVLAIAGGGALWWRHQRAHFLMRQYQGELERRALAQHLDYLAKYANDIILLVDGNGRIIEANDRALSSYGYPREELVGLRIEAIQPDDGAAFARRQGLAEGHGVVFESVHRRKDGSSFPTEISLRAIDVDGRQFYQGIVRDITERKRAEERLRLAAQVFESSSEGIVVTDADNRIISVNRAYTEITGYAPEEAIGRNPRLLSSGRQEPEFYRAMWTAIETKGRWEGELWNRRKNGEVYPQWLNVSTIKDESGRICNHIGFFSDITARKAAAERIQFLAHYDALTRLPNRFLLHERLQQAVVHHQRYRKQLALFFLDLDRFKAINDALGHAAGDELLQAVAQRLQSCVREGDTVARLGGDEFVIVLPELDEAGAATLVARKIIDAVGRPYLLRDHHLTTSPSIGISIFPDDGPDIETLMQHADIAMYYAKAEGRNNYQFYTEAMNIRDFEFLTMQNALRDALAQGQLVLHYQPQMDVRSGTVIGVEALLRWQHPQKGLLPAAAFVPIAEASGLMVPIGEWVLATACEQNRRWQQQGLPVLRMTVNISAQQFRQRSFAQTVAQVLERTGMAAGELSLDLSESTVMADAEAASPMLAALAGLGAHISIDDFGSGYCNLRQLQRLAIDSVKLDPSFVRDIGASADEAAIAGAIIGMAKSMKLKVLAEGVETQDQFTILRAQHCDEIQGYYFSAQLPADEVAELLAA